MKLLILFLIANAGCAGQPVSTKFDAKWVFVRSSEGSPLACLPREHVIRLRKVLISCKEDKSN